MKHRRRVSGGAQDPSPAAKPAAREWCLHDFRKPRPLKEDELRALDALHSRFAENLAAALSSALRSRVQARLASVAQRPYFEFIQALSSPTSLHLVYSHPHRVPMVLECGLGVLLAMVERLLGGRGDGAGIARRPPTRVERPLVDAIARRALSVLAETWAQGPGFRLDLAESEHNPLLVQIVGPSDPTLVLEFEVSFGVRAEPLHLAMPLGPFQAIIAKLVRTAPGNDSERGPSEERERALRRISESSVSVSAELPAVPISLKDLLSLRPGDLIDTQIPRGSEAHVVVEGRRLFRGLPGSQDGRRVVRITRLESAPPPGEA